MSEVVASGTTAGADERHATNLELFLDLVFVFAVTQIASLISHHPTGTGTAKGFLIALLVWWQWSQFTWAGSAIDLQRTARTRVLVLGCIPVTLIMTISIPDAFDSSGVWFAAAYMGVQLLVLGMQGSVSLVDPLLRPAFIRYASLATVAPVVVLVVAFVPARARAGVGRFVAVRSVRADTAVGGVGAASVDRGAARRGAAGRSQGEAGVLAAMSTGVLTRQDGVRGLLEQACETFRMTGATLFEDDSKNSRAGGRAIEVYEHNTLEVKGGAIMINGTVATSYTFKQDYYWMMGDNRHNSADSRSWGYVPEDHIVGRPVFIWLSLDKDKSWFQGKIRWNRFGKNAKR